MNLASLAIESPRCGEVNHATRPHTPQFLHTLFRGSERSLVRGALLQRELAHQGAGGALRLADDAQGLGIELDADQPQTGDAGFDLDAVDRLAEFLQRLLDALLRAGG